jgi:hypothetical protein
MITGRALAPRNNCGVVCHLVDCPGAAAVDTVERCGLWGVQVAIAVCTYLRVFIGWTAVSVGPINATRNAALCQMLYDCGADMRGRCGIRWMVLSTHLNELLQVLLHWATPCNAQ